MTRATAVTAGGIVSARYLAVERQGGAGCVPPRVGAARGPQGPGGEPLPGGPIRDEPGERRGQGTGIAGRHQPRRTGIGKLTEAPDVADHGGATERERGGEHAGEVHALG